MTNGQYDLLKPHVALFAAKHQYVGCCEAADGAFGQPRSKVGQQLRAAQRDAAKQERTLLKYIREVAR